MEYGFLEVRPDFTSCLHLDRNYFLLPFFYAASRSDGSVDIDSADQNVLLKRMTSVQKD